MSLECFLYLAHSLSTTWVFVVWQGRLTFLGALFEAVIDLLKHGLAASLKHRKHNALERLFVRRLDGPLHGFGGGSTNGICRVLGKRQQQETFMFKRRKNKQTRNKHSNDGRGSGCWVVSPPTFDLTTLLTLSFKVTSTAVSLAAMVLLSWPVTGSRLLEIAEDGTELRRQINKSERVIKDAAEKNGNNLSWY